MTSVRGDAISATSVIWPDFRSISQAIQLGASLSCSKKFVQVCILSQYSIFSACAQSRNLDWQHQQDWKFAKRLPVEGEKKQRQTFRRKKLVASVQNAVMQT